jgi:DNA-binding transcriptional LysR family regulator
MTKRLLEIYLTVCDTASMTQAAEQLGMSQPSVSGAIVQLEKNYETRLFERHGKTLELTSQGRRLRQYAETILDQYDRAWESIHETENAVSVPVGITNETADTFLPSLARYLLSENAERKFCFKTGTSNELMGKLLHHEIDLCIADRREEENGLTCLPLYKEEYCAVCSDSYSRENSFSLAELKSSRLLLREEGSGSRTCFEAAAVRKSFRIDPFLEAESDFSLMKLAESGLGIAVIPRKLAEKSLKKKRLHTIRIKGADFRRQYYLIYRSDMYIDQDYSSLIDEIKECAEKEYD